MVSSLYKVFAGYDHVTRDSDEFTREGYILTGWNTQPDGTGIDIACLSTLSPSSDMSFYAQWQSAATDYTFNIYPFDEDYTSTIQVDGKTYTTTQQENIFQLPPGKTATLKVSNSPAIEIIPVDGTFGGEEKVISNDNDIGERTFTFTVGEFTSVNILKIGTNHTFNYNGKAKTRLTEYEQCGSIAGGLTYIYQWYDDMIFIPSGTKTTTSADYTYQLSDTSFINLAHKGTDTSHEVSAWLVCQDMETGNIVLETGPFKQTGLYSSPGEKLKNYSTHYFLNISVDLTEYPLSSRFQIGASVQDYGSTECCTGVKFRGKYKIIIIE